MRQPQIRMAPQLGDNQISTLSQLPEETEAPPA
jgi:hypothetical protein